MFLRSDFQAALVAAISSRPAAATAYQAGDPRLLAQVEAIATMLAMLSQQIDAAESEPFLKARAGTVLADAALKGALPLGRPAKVQVSVTNPAGSTSVSLSAGRGILDGKGRRYAVEGAATIAAGTTATVTALQLTSREITHTVSGTTAFYAVQVPPSPEGLFLVGLNVADAIGDFAYTVEFCNVAAGDRVFHVETNEYRQLFIRFGADDTGSAVVGHQPANGDVLTITASECGGLVELDAGAAFSMEYVGSTAEGLLTLALDSILAAGAAPPDIDVLRMLARYPALHDANAVFLSNFDFLLRKHLVGVEFLSVWNEQAEEAVRGASVLNINRLFVSIRVPSQSDATTQAQVRQIVARADDSLRVVFVAAVLIAQPITVTASVAAVHDTGDVSAQIRNTLLALYGQGTVKASRGLARTFRMQEVHTALKAGVPALQDQISDFTATLGSLSGSLPEDFRYLATGSITVTVTQVQDNIGLWGA
jgi:hypothetical protein